MTVNPPCVHFAGRKSSLSPGHAQRSEQRTVGSDEVTSDKRRGRSSGEQGSEEDRRARKLLAASAHTVLGAGASTPGRRQLNQGMTHLDASEDHASAAVHVGVPANGTYKQVSISQ